MINKLKKFILLDFKIKCFYFESFFWLLFCRIIILIFPFRYLVNFIGKINDSNKTTLNTPALETAETVTLIIKNISQSKIIFWKNQCLNRALAGFFLLKTHHIKTTIHIGVRRNQQKFEAHAWLKTGDIVLLGGEESDNFIQLD